MNNLPIDFNHCFTAYQREILGDKKCQEIALNILRRFDISLEIKKQTYQELNQRKKGPTSKLTIEKIKKECIEIDMSNIDAGDDSIGTYIGGEFFQFRDLHDVELFYSNINLKDLLEVYASYNGLKDLQTSESDHYRETYNLDILAIMDLLKD